MTTFAPSEARSRAQAAPKPEAPPVTRNVCDAISMWVVQSGNGQVARAPADPLFMRY
jgi:hypothetical protein